MHLDGLPIFAKVPLNTFLEIVPEQERRLFQSRCASPIRDAYQQPKFFYFFLKHHQSVPEQNLRLREIKFPSILIGALDRVQDFTSMRENLRMGLFEIYTSKILRMQAA